MANPFASHPVRTAVGAIALVIMAALVLILWPKPTQVAVAPKPLAPIAKVATDKVGDKPAEPATLQPPITITNPDGTTVEVNADEYTKSADARNELKLRALADALQKRIVALESRNYRVDPKSADQISVIPKDLSRYTSPTSAPAPAPMSEAPRPVTPLVERWPDQRDLAPAAKPTAERIAPPPVDTTFRPVPPKNAFPPAPPARSPAEPMVRKSHIVGQAHAAVVTQPLPGPKAWNRASPEQRVQIAERLCNKKVEDIGYGMTRFTAERLLGSLDYRSAKAQLREMCPDVRVSELALNDEDDDDQTPYEVAGPVMARGNVNVNIAPPRHNGRARHGRGEMDDDQYAILQAYKGHLATMKGRMGTVHMDRQPPEDAVPCRPRGFNHTVLCRQNERRY